MRLALFTAGFVAGVAVGSAGVLISALLTHWDQAHLDDEEDIDIEAFRAWWEDMSS